MPRYLTPLHLAPRTCGPDLSARCTWKNLLRDVQSDGCNDLHDLSTSWRAYQLVGTKRNHPISWPDQVSPRFQADRASSYQQQRVSLRGILMALGKLGQAPQYWVILHTSAMQVINRLRRPRVSRL
jgi:hypothetical protein